MSNHNTVPNKLQAQINDSVRVIDCYYPLNGWLRKYFFAWQPLFDYKKIVSQT